MYLAEILSNVDYQNNNVGIIGRRNSGKTTYLLSCIDAISSSTDKIIVIIDSATEHKDKSLLCKIQQKYGDWLYLQSMSIDELHTADISKLETVRYYDEILNNHNRIILVDVSMFLEHSFDVEDCNERTMIRKLYQYNVYLVLVLVRAILSNYIVVMDEIEFNDDILDVLEQINYDGNTFINAMHDITYMDDMRNVFMVNADKYLLNSNCMLAKIEKQLCGNACAEVIAILFYDMDGHRFEDMIWIPEIALFLKSIGISVQLRYYNSSLYKAYVLGNDIYNRGVLSLGEYLANDNDILESEITLNTVIDEIDNNRCVLYCVYNRDNIQVSNRSSGHYVVAYRDAIGDRYVLNPGRSRITREHADIDKIVVDCRSHGGWRIICQ